MTFALIGIAFFAVMWATHVLAPALVGPVFLALIVLVSFADYAIGFRHAKRHAAQTRKQEDRLSSSNVSQQLTNALRR